MYILNDFYHLGVEWPEFSREGKCSKNMIKESGKGCQ